MWVLCIHVFEHYNSQKIIFTYLDIEASGAEPPLNFKSVHLCSTFIIE